MSSLEERMRWAPGDPPPAMAASDVLAMLGVLDSSPDVQREAVQAAVAQGQLGEYALRAVQAPASASGAVASRGSTEQLLSEWQERATLALFAYNRAANRARSWDFRTGAASSIIAAVTATAVFATLEREVSTTARVLAATVTLVAAALSALRTFSGLSDRVEAYEQAARRYGALRREIEEARLYSEQARLDDLRRKLDEAARTSPNAPARIWNRARRQMKGEFTRTERVVSGLRGLPAPKSLGRGESGVGESLSDDDVPLLRE